MISHTLFLCFGALLLGIMVLNLGMFTYLRMRYADALRQAQAVGFLKCLGCTFVYRHEWDEVKDCPVEFSNHKRLFSNLLGERHWVEPTGMLLTDFKDNATRLTPLAELATITDLAIIDSPGITDAIFRTLIELKALRTLSLHGTSVTGTGVLQLAQLPKLKKLMISATHVEHADLHDLRLRMPTCSIEHNQELAKHYQEESRRLFGSRGIRVDSE